MYYFRTVETVDRVTVRRVAFYVQTTSGRVTYYEQTTSYEPTELGELFLGGLLLG